MEKPIEIILRGGQFKQFSEHELQDIKKRYALKRIEMEILYVLSICSEDDTVVGLHDYLSVNKGHVSQTMFSLCDRGYVTAEQDKRDRRYTHYHLTEEGQRIAAEIKEVWTRMREDIFDGISEEEIAAFTAVVNKICRNLELKLA